MLIVLDNADDLIAFDKANFKWVLHQIVEIIPTCKVLLTSNIRLQSIKDYSEEVILLYELSTHESLSLFTKLSRPIKIQEQNELLKQSADIQKFPAEKNMPYPRKLHDHHLFRLMCGNPATIVMLAPMLADTERPLTLTGLYRILCEPTNSDDGVMQAIQLSVHVSIREL